MKIKNVITVLGLFITTLFSLLLFAPNALNKATAYALGGARDGGNSSGEGQRLRVLEGLKQGVNNTANASNRGAFKISPGMKKGQIYSNVKSTMETLAPGVKFSEEEILTVSRNAFKNTMNNKKENAVIENSTSLQKFQQFESYRINHNSSSMTKEQNEAELKAGLKAEVLEYGQKRISNATPDQKEALRNAAEASYKADVESKKTKKEADEKDLKNKMEPLKDKDGKFVLNGKQVDSISREQMPEFLKQNEGLDYVNATFGLDAVKAAFKKVKKSTGEYEKVTAPGALAEWTKETTTPQTIEQSRAANEIIDRTIYYEELIRKLKNNENVFEKGGFDYLNTKKGDTYSQQRLVYKRQLEAVAQITGVKLNKKQEDYVVKHSIDSGSVTSTATVKSMLEAAKNGDINGARAAAKKAEELADIENNDELKSEVDKIPPERMALIKAAIIAEIDKNIEEKKKAAKIAKKKYDDYENYLKSEGLNGGRDSEKQEAQKMLKSLGK